MLEAARPFIEKGWHPTKVVSGYMQCLKDAEEEIQGLAKTIDIEDREALLSVIASSIGTKFISRWSDLMCGLALDGILCVRQPSDQPGVPPTIDFKRYCRVEKIPGGSIEDSAILDGIMINKDVTHASMRREIRNPRILLLDCPLEYKKGESKTDIEMSEEADFDEILRQEETFIKTMCDQIIAAKPDVVCTEKGLSDRAQQHLVDAGITALRRLRKTDNNRLARACGATIVSRTSGASPACPRLERCC